MVGVGRSRRRNPMLNVHTHVIDKVAVANGVISGVALYPQVIKVLVTQSYTSVAQASF